MVGTCFGKGVPMVSTSTTCARHWEKTDQTKNPHFARTYFWKSVCAKLCFGKMTQTSVWKNHHPMTRGASANVVLQYAQHVSFIVLCWASRPRIAAGCPTAMSKGVAMQMRNDLTLCIRSVLPSCSLDLFFATNWIEKFLGTTRVSKGGPGDSDLHAQFTSCYQPITMNPTLASRVSHNTCHGAFE